MGALGKLVGSVSLTALLVGAVVALPASAGSAAKTRLVSKTSAGEPATGGDSSNPSISASGRYVAFASDATNLPGRPVLDVYVHDRNTGKTKLVSKTSAGDPADGHSGRASISASGRYVAFRSEATNLPGEGTLDVYVHDRETGKTKLVSKTSAGDPASGGSGISTEPSISASGRYVAFRSEATNLPGEGTSDVYVHDRETGKTRLVSKTSAGEPATGGGSFSPSVSSTGRYVAFDSAATNLPGDALTDVYVHDRKTGKTKLVSKTSAGELADDSSSGPSISASGRYVAFQSLATNLPGEAVRDVYIRDRKTGKTRLVSKTSAGEPATGGESFVPSVSSTGRYVAFYSAATNLPGDDAVTDVYVHDRETGKTRLVSKTSAGEPATGGDSRDPSISASGRYVAFDSAATNLPGDDSFRDVYVRGPLG